MADLGLIFVFPATPTRCAGAGSQLGPALTPGKWYTMTSLAAFRIIFVPGTSGPPTALATSLVIPAGRWDFVAVVGQEQMAVIDAAGGNVEVFVMRTDGGG